MGLVSTALWYHTYLGVIILYKKMLSKAFCIQALFLFFFLKIVGIVLPPGLGFCKCALKLVDVDFN